MYLDDSLLLIRIVNLTILRVKCLDGRSKIFGLSITFGRSRPAAVASWESLVSTLLVLIVLIIIKV